MAIKKVTDPKKIVTDPLVLQALTRQSIDKDYVELWQDYGPRCKGLSPYLKQYRDLKSGKRIMIVSPLPKVNHAGEKICGSNHNETAVGWEKVGVNYHSKPNIFSARVIIPAARVIVRCLNVQPSGAESIGHEGIITAAEAIPLPGATWQPQLFLNGIEQTSGDVTLLDTDPVNENYHQNTLEWDYGICKRRLRIIEGRIKEKWIFAADPGGEVRIKHNLTGDLPLRLGRGSDVEAKPLEVTVSGDEEVVPASEFARADIVYPVEIGANPDTFYPDAHPETASVDGLVYEATQAIWATIRTAAGDGADDSGDTALVGSSCSATEDEYNRLYRILALFDTSGIGELIIASAVLSLRGSAKLNNIANADINVYSSAPASDDELVAGDYATLGGTPFCDTAITWGDWVTGGYNDFTLNAAGLAAINKTGISKFGARSAYHDVGNNPPPWVSDTYRGRIYCWTTDKGADYQPKLVVTYESPSVTSNDPTNITSEGATLQGEITGLFGEVGDERGFDYGLTAFPETKPTSHLIHQESGTGWRDGMVAGIEMPNGNIIAAWEHFAYADLNTGLIRASISTDGGETWGAPYTLQDTALLRDVEPQFLVLGSTVYFFYTVADWNGLPNIPATIYYRTSTDNGASWSDAVEIATSATLLRTGSNPIRMASGRIILPLLFSDVTWLHAGTIYYSDDNCATWHRGGDITKAGKEFSGQDVVELSDGTLYMIMRNLTDGLHIWKSTSADEGATWTTPEATSIQSSNSIAHILKLANEHIILVWNNVSSAGSLPRNPLTAARSIDDCATWLVKFNIADDPDDYGYSNHSLFQKSNGEIICLYGDEREVLSGITRVKSAIFSDYETWTETGTFGTGTFEHAISGLNPSTTYHFRAKAHTPGGGWGYGADKEFATRAEVDSPTATTGVATALSAIAATLNGTLVFDGGEACDCGFQWGETIAYGNTTPTQSRTTGQTFSQVIAGLDPNKTYHFRAFATNSVTTSHGADRTFLTLVALPTATTNPITGTSTLNGTLDNDGGAACDCGFEWGETIAYEHGATPTQSRTTGQTFSQILGGLVPGTTYHYRAFATNGAGTSYGADRTFALPAGIPTVTTNPATGLGIILAVINGTLDGDGGEICDCGFEWGTDLTYGITTPTESKITGETFSQVIRGLFPGTGYHFRSFATNSHGTAYGDDESFYSKPSVSRAYALAREEL